MCRGIVFDDTSTSGDKFSADVDIYNASSNSWTSDPAGLGQTRSRLAATSLPSGLVFFAGGVTTGDVCRVCICRLFKAVDWQWTLSRSQALFNDCDHHINCSSDENAYVRSDGNAGVY